MAAVATIPLGAPSSSDTGASERINIKLEFGSVRLRIFPSFDYGLTFSYSSRGGMELLFNKERNHNVSLPSTVPDGSPTNVAYLISWIRDNLLKGNVKLFMEGQTV